MDVAARLEAVEADNDRLRARIEILEQSFGMDFLPPIEWGLTAHESKVLGVLMKREAVTKEGIMAALYDGRDDPEIKIVDVFVCKLRRKLKPFGVEVATLWGRGYQMSAENKRRVTEALGQMQVRLEVGAAS